MGNFAVAASDELIKQGTELMETIMLPGEKKSDTLKRMFEIVSRNIEHDKIQQGGVDADALEASLINIRNMFVSAVSGREEILAEKNKKIDEIREAKEQSEKELREKISELMEALSIAEQKAMQAENNADQAIKETLTAREQVEMSKKLVGEKEKTINTLAGKLSIAEEKSEKFDDLKAENITLNNRITELERAILDEKKDAEFQLEKVISQKEIEFEQRIREYEKEKDCQLRAADKENAKLQAKIELLEEQLKNKQD